MAKVKICGITNKEDALKATELGAWALGFIFYKKSPRYVSPYKASKIIAELPPFVTPVGVFVNHNERAAKDMADFCGITTLQFHGDESPEYCSRFKNYRVIKAFRVKEGISLNTLDKFRVTAFLFDAFDDNAYGGTGKTFRWDILKSKRINKPFILSGGLNSQNIAEAIQTVNPYAVDVSSGVEAAAGKKNYKLLAEFLKNST